MSDKDIYERLTPIFHDVFDDDDLNLEADLSKDDVEGWTSLSNIRLLGAIEEEFELRFGIEEIAEVASVGQLVDLIAGKAVA